MKEKNIQFRAISFFLKQYKVQIIVLSILSLLVGILEAISVAAVYPILTTAFDDGLEGGNFILSHFAGLVGRLPIADPFTAYCLIFVFIALLTFGVRYLFINFRVGFSARLVEGKQNEIFNKYMKADFQFFTDHKQGELVYDIGRAPQGLSDLIVPATGLLSEAVLSAAILLLLFSLSWVGTLITLLIGILYLLGTRYFAKKVSYSSAQGELEAITKSNVILNEVISGIQQVKVFSTAEYWADRFAGTIRKRWYHFKRRSRALQLPTPVLMLVLYLFIGVGAMMMNILFPDKFVTLIPVFGTFAFAIFRLVPIVAKVGGLTMNIMSALPNCEICYSIMNKEIAHIVDGKKELASFKSEIAFDHVSFAYNGQKEVLQDISLRFERGKTTALVGRSGSGKTTIVNLILRLYDVQKGEVSIDDKNIKAYRMASLLDKMGYVSQDAFAFNDTVRDNITFGLKYSDQEIINAAKYADAHSFIINLENGYDTLVGDKGVKLSGGQRQRIAVARAMIRQPEILIFDEATNALDNISQLAVQKAIEEISKDHTVIVIAHRLTTIRNADKIVVMENGRVREQGTHEELIEKTGVYWNLYRGQPIEGQAFDCVPITPA